METRVYLKHWKNTNLYYAEVFGGELMMGRGFISRETFLLAREKAQVLHEDRSRIELQSREVPRSMTQIPPRHLYTTRQAA